VQSHGRAASFQAPAIAAPREHGRGHGGEGREGHGNPHVAQAAPQGGPNWTAAGDHGAHGPPPQAAQPQGGGDQGHGKGHDKGGGQGQDKGQDKGKGGGEDHGKGHGH
jgi:hypothetical protein